MPTSHPSVLPSLSPEGRVISSRAPSRGLLSGRLPSGALLAVLGLSGCASSQAPQSKGEVLTAQLGTSTLDVPLPTHEGNPFVEATMFVNPDYTAAVERLKIKTPALSRQLEVVARTPTAIWLDSIEKAGRVAKYLDAAEQERKASGKPVVVTLVAYDLPNRDCAAKSSAGELSVDHNGDALYRTEFVDRLATSLAAFPKLRVVVILEPDSLANLATNLDQPKCAASEGAYKHGVAYAIKKLQLPNTALYLDAAHAGWLGWSANRAKIGKIYKEVLEEAGGVDKIRGFATNVSNYNVLRGDDGAALEPTNPCPDELTYVKELADSLRWAGIVHKGFIVDTSRNGQSGTRQTWGSWCNVAKAGLGERPRAEPVPLVDAYLWVKPPGESDGTTDRTAARFDASCLSPDSAPNAPQAGELFTAHFLDLVARANPPL